jgi:spore coat polysaccharide biosynthesis protein SpsF
MSLRTVTVVQARRGSSRFPDKVSKDILGKTLLERMVERVKSARLAGTVVVATTDNPGDDLIEELCARNGWHCFRGHETDLLDRHYQVAVQYEAEFVAKIPSDVPLIDPRIIDRVFSFFLDNHSHFDYVSNLHPASYPDGMDVEIMHTSILKRAWEEATKPMEREHCTPYIWENPDLFRIGNVSWESGLDYSMSHRLTIDYPEDYELIKDVFENLYPLNPMFSLEDILEFLHSTPEVFQKNAKFAGVNWYRNHLDELKTIRPEQTKKEK